MVDINEWKRAYYEPKSHKRLFIIILIIIIALSASYLFLKSWEGKPVDAGIKLTTDDITYSNEGLESEEIKNDFEFFSTSANGLTDIIKNQTGYGWAELIRNPNYGKNCKISAVLYIISENSIIGFEYGYLQKLNPGPDLDDEILSLPIYEIDANDTSKIIFYC